MKSPAPFFMTVAVRPAADEPFPDVYTAIGAWKLRDASLASYQNLFVSLLTHKHQLKGGSGNPGHNSSIR